MELFFHLFGCKEPLGTQKSQGFLTMATTWLEILSIFIYLLFSSIRLNASNNPIYNCIKKNLFFVLLIFVTLYLEHYLGTVGALEKAAAYLSIFALFLFYGSEDPDF